MAYLRNGTGCPLVSYSELAQRWGLSKATVGRVLRKLEKAGHISLFTFPGRHKNGEIYYWLLYYTYLSPQKFQNTEEIIEQLQPHIRDISRATYFRKLEKAIEALSSILWGYTSKDCTALLAEFIPQ